MGKQVRLTNEYQREEFINAIKRDPLPQAYEYVSTKTRSLSANALFHIWCREAAKHFGLKIQHGIEPEEQMKMVFKEQFLGRQTIKVRNFEFKDELRHTSKLEPAEMSHFMEQIQSWCASKGCALSNPADNEYARWQAEQTR